MTCPPLPTLKDGKTQVVSTCLGPNCVFCANVRRIREALAELDSCSACGGLYGAPITFRDIAERIRR